MLSHASFFPFYMQYWGFEHRALSIQGHRSTNELYFSPPSTPFSSQWNWSTEQSHPRTVYHHDLGSSQAACHWAESCKGCPKSCHSHREFSSEGPKCPVPLERTEVIYSCISQTLHPDTCNPRTRETETGEEP